MPNLAKTQVVWTDMFREFCQFIRYWRIARGLQFRFQKGRIRVYETYDSSNYYSLWTLTGAKRGINCTEDGRLYVKLTDETPGAGQSRTQLYMDSGLTQLVAQGDVADGGTATLAAQNSSGLSGTVKLGTVTTSPTNIVLILDIDEIVKNNRAFDLSTIGDVNAYGVITARTASLGTSFQSLLQAIKSDIDNGYINSKLREFLFSIESSVVSVTEQTDSNGDIQVTYQGILADLINDMGDDSIPQSVLQNGVTNGSPSYDANNVGVGVLTILNLRQNMESGKLQLTCITGKDDTLTEIFSAKLISSIDNTVLQGRLNLTIKKQWESQTLGVRAQVDRTITDANDGGNQVSTYIVSGETLSNTDKGDLYLNLEAGAFAGGNNRRVRWYQDAARGLLVAEGLRVGDGTVTMLAQNNSGLTGSCVIAYASDDIDIIVHLNPFKVGDIITLTVTNDRAGIIQSLFMDIWDVPLPSSGAPTLPDTLIKEGTDHLVAVS